MPTGRQPQGPHHWRGKDYRTQEELALAAGVTRPAVSRHYQIHKNYDTLGNGRGSTLGRPGRPTDQGTPLTVLDEQFTSIRGFAKHVGRPFNTVLRWLHKGHYEKLEAALKEHNDAAAKS